METSGPFLNSHAYSSRHHLCGAVDMAGTPVAESGHGNVVAVFHVVDFVASLFEIGSDRLRVFNFLFGGRAVHLDVQLRPTLHQKAMHTLQGLQFHSFDINFDQVRERQRVLSDFVVEAHHRDQNLSRRFHRAADLIFDGRIAGTRSRHEGVIKKINRSGNVGNSAIQNLYIVEFIQPDIGRSSRVVSRIRFPGDDLLRFAGEEQGDQPFECSDVVHDFARERQLPQKFYFGILAGLDWKKPQASLSAHSGRQAVPDGVGVIAEKLLTKECDYQMAQSEVPASKAVQADGLLSYSKISNHWTKRKLPADFQRVRAC